MPLTTLARVKAHGGIQGTTDDAEITELIASVSKRMQEYLRRNIETATITDERYDGPVGTPLLYLRSWPIKILTAVRWWDGSAWTVITSDVEAEAQDLEVGRLLYKPDDVYTNWPTGRRVIAVDYAHGYDAADIPANILDAATRQVLYQWAQRTRIGERSTGGDPSVVATYLIDDWLPGVKQTLDGMREPRAEMA